MANLKNGLGGAASGAAAGSALGPIGTGIGAGIGGLIGLFGGGDNSNNPYVAQGTNIDTVSPAQMAAANGQVDTGLAQQQAFLNALNAQNGIANQSQVYNQLQGVANGTGPNPAQMMLNQATGANVANQAALMAGQRGAGANVGLMARQAANQGANIQQQAAGQAATLQANQSLGAMGQAGNIAGQQVGNLANTTQALNQNALNQQGQFLGAQSAANNARVNMMSNINNVNSGQQSTVNAANQAQIGGLLNGAGAAATALGGAFKGGGDTSTPATDANFKMPQMQASAPQAGPSLGNFQYADGGAIQGPRSFVGQHLAKGGKVDTMLSPGEVYVAPSKANAKDPIKAGTKVPGKAKVPGAKNDYKNDTVPRKLEEGGIVIPRSITQGKNPHEAAAKFVAAILAKQGIQK